MLKYGLIAFLVIIQFQLALSKDFGEECCIRFPKAMDINTFQTRVSWFMFGWHRVQRDRIHIPYATCTDTRSRGYKTFFILNSA